jgi:hypothetical protein
MRIVCGACEELPGRQIHQFSDARRIAIENALSDVQRRALEEDCHVLGVAPHRWQEVATLRIKYESTAVASLTLRLRREQGVSWTYGLMSAAIELDLNYDTVRKRLSEWKLRYGNSHRARPAHEGEPTSGS